MTSRRTFIRTSLAASISVAGRRTWLAAQEKDARMPHVIVCDVNETLLDIGALEPHFQRAFGEGRVLQDWFANVLLYSEVATLAGPYAEFASIGGAALDMVASARGMTLSVADRSRILQGMLTLPAH